MERKELTERVTIRVQKGKEQVYPQFKELVCNVLHSDVCFVTTELWEMFVTAMSQNPPLNPKAMSFPRQNVQINMGCTIHYNTKRARRVPQDKKLLDLDKNHLLPLLIEEWEILTPKAKAFWIQALKERGILPPPISTASTGTFQKAKLFLKKLYGLVYDFCHKR